MIQIMEERDERGTVLIIGATGQQGSAVARHLMETGFGVRALARDLHKPRARALAEGGIELVQGDLDDHTSVERALYGTTACSLCRTSSRPAMMERYARVPP